MNSFTKNWITTLIGFLSGSFAVVYDLMQTGTVNWKTAIAAILVFAMGYFAKDGNKSGGTKQI